MKLEPKEGFDWGHITWGRPDSVPSVLCSYCSASIGDDDMPLIMSNREGWTARFCEACQKRWWGPPMSRLLYVILLVSGMSITTPAEACRLFSIWRYPWAQRCPLTHARPLMRGYDAWKTRSDLDDWAAKNHKEEIDMPLPELTPIDGEEADDEARAKLELKAKLEPK